jgi:hypothetical protein
VAPSGTAFDALVAEASADWAMMLPVDTLLELSVDVERHLRVGLPTWLMTH